MVIIYQCWWFWSLHFNWRIYNRCQILLLHEIFARYKHKTLQRYNIVYTICRWCVFPLSVHALHVFGSVKIHLEFIPVLTLSLFLLPGCYLLLQDRCCFGCGCYSRGSASCHHHLSGFRYTSYGQEECHRAFTAVRRDPRLHICDLLRQDRNPYNQSDVCLQGENNNGGINQKIQ